MLNPECRAFRSAWESGAERDPHPTHCASCAAWVRGARSAPEARLRLRPSGELRSALAAIPDTDARRRLSIEPVPRLPLPERLRQRLYGIARAGRRAEPPAWALSPRWAVAASYLLTLLLGIAGNPATTVAEAVDRLRPRAEASWGRLDSAARSRLESVERAVTETYQESATTLAAKLVATRDQIRALAAAVTAADEAPTPDPEPEPAPTSEGETHE